MGPLLFCVNQGTTKRGCRSFGSLGDGEESKWQKSSIRSIDNVLLSRTRIDPDGMTAVTVEPR